MCDDLTPGLVLLLICKTVAPFYPFGFGYYCAIQCKFYSEDHTLQKRDIDSFFSELGKSMYSSGMMISTTDQWSKHAEETLQEQL
ncbi:hypothetical protein [Halalkalibacter lacteus]|uniref:restriction endonuclease n=1 Tax=Halalkalibacter lacteus TaxID=3090663 RepID=UPI002FC7C4F3